MSESEEEEENKSKENNTNSDSEECKEENDNQDNQQQPTTSRGERARKKPEFFGHNVMVPQLSPSVKLNLKRTEVN